MSWLDDALTLEAADQLPPDWKADLDTLRAAGEAPAALARDATPEVTPEGPSLLRRAAATAVEVGAPVVGAMVGAASPVPGGVLAGGAIGGAAGRVAGDWIRGEDSSVRGVAASAALGAIPGGAAAKVGGSVVRQTLAHALEGGVIGLGSEVVRHGIEEGRLPTLPEAGMGLAVGAVTGGVVGGVVARGTAAAETEAQLASEFAASKAVKPLPTVPSEAAAVLDQAQQLTLPGVKIEQAAEKLGTEAGATTTEHAVQIGLFDATGHIREGMPPLTDHASWDATDRLTQVVKNEGVQAAELLASTEPGRRNARLYKQVAAAFHTGLLDAPGLVAQLQESGMSLPEFIKDYYVPSIRLAGQQLQQLSSLRKHINAMGGEGKAALNELSQMSPSVKFAEWIQKLEDTRRTLLISQVKTGVRNGVGQGVAYGTDLLEQGMRQAVGGEGDFFGSIASLGRAWHKDESRNALMGMLKGRRDLMEKIGEHEFRPSNTFLEAPGPEASRVGGMVQTAVHATLGKFVNATTWINVAQESFFRRAVFDSSVRQSLKNAGLNVEEHLASNLERVPSELRDKILDHATDRALELTFAKSDPGGKMAEKIIEGFQTARPVTTFITPFPRYMGNAFAYVVKRSPLGLARLATEHGRQEWGKVTSEAMTGTMLFSGALALRYSAHGGEKWYEIKRDNGDKVDIRGVLGPFTPYLFAADAMKQYLDTGKVNYKGSDVVEGILSMNRLTGTAQTMLSWMRGDVDDTKGWAAGIGRIAGEWVGGFSTPARNIKDAMLLAGRAEEGTYKDIREFPMTGPTRQNVPGLLEGLPDSISSTRGEPMPTEYPFPSSVLGLNIRSSTGLENELARMNISPAELAPRTGYPKADREVARRSGKLIAAVGPTLIADPQYKAAGDATKEVIIRQVFSEARKAALEHLAKTNPAIALVLKAHGELTPTVKSQLKDAGVDYEARFQEVLDAAPEGGEQPTAAAPAPAAPPPPASTGEVAGVVKDGRVTPEAVHDAAILVGVNPKLLAAVMKQESAGGKVGVTSYQDAHGPMQMLPATFEEWRPQVEAITGHQASVDAPFDNLIAGALMYRQLLEEHGSVEEAARFYHGGPNTRQHGPKTKAYGQIVSANFEREDTP